MRFSVFSVSDYYPDIQPDPHRFFHEQIDLAVITEEMGYFAYFNAEHHFHEYGLIPDPAMLLSAVAMKTERVLLGPAVSVLPFHNPLRAAEQWALLDQFSNGRLFLGVGSGYLMHEFEGFSMSPAQKREIFDENLQIMELALTGERFSYSGQFHNFNNVRLNLTPYKGRKLEMAIAVLSEIASYYIGRRGYKIMTIPYATVETIEDLTPVNNNYHKGWSENDRDGWGEIISGVHVHVGDKPAANDDVARKYLEKYVYSRLYARHSTYDECLERGVIATGTPDDVAKGLQRFINTGVDHLMFIFNFGGLPLDEVHKSMELMKKEVLPQLKEAPESVRTYAAASA